MAINVYIVRPLGGADGKQQNKHQVLKPAGLQGPLDQPKTQRYLSKVIGNGALEVCLKKCLNEVFSNPPVAGTEGKFNGNLQYDDKPTRHASAGPIHKGSSVTLFFYVTGNCAYIFAMGEHSGKVSYDICHFGPADGPFKKGGTVVLPP